MADSPRNVYLYFTVGSLLSLVALACSSESKDNSGHCWYTLWYIWFVLGLFVIVFVVLIILYVKHRSKQRSRVRRLHRSSRTAPVPAVPQLPPGYTEPSHKPPTYDEAMLGSRTIQPGTIPGYTGGEYYEPPPTSMRMATVILNTPQPQPPSYTASTTSNQGRRGQGHPV